MTAVPETRTILPCRIGVRGRLAAAFRPRRLLGSLLAVASLALASATAIGPAAAADLVRLDWTGTVLFGGNDNLNLFGLQNIDLTGRAYTASYIYDTSVNFVENLTDSTQSVSGGTFFNPFRPSPLVSASITVNGITVDVGGSFFGSYFTQSGLGVSGILTDAIADRNLDQGSFPSRYAGQIFNNARRLDNGFALPLNQTATYDFDASVNVANSAFRFLTLDAQDNILGASGFGLRPERLFISQPGAGAVPEAGTWAMLIAGFGLVGAVARRRRLASA